MECKECSKLLYEYIDDELEQEVRHEVETHLSVCSACRATLLEIQEALSLYHNHISAANVSEGFSDRVVASLLDDEDIQGFTTPIVAFGLSLLAVLALTYILLCPLIDPLFRIAFRLTVNLLSLPAMMLSAFPLFLYSGISVLVVAFLILTWATRRAVLS